MDAKQKEALQVYLDEWLEKRFKKLRSELKEEFKKFGAGGNGVEAVKEGAARPNKKDPNEPMSFEKFYSECKKSTRRDINIVGEWSDTLRQMKLLNGEYNTRGQWQVFTRRNLRVAKEMKHFNDDQISSATEEAEKHWEQNGKYKFTLETVCKFLVK